MEFDRRPVVAGALVQAAVLGGYLVTIEGMSPLAFALGLVGGAVAGGLTRGDGAWVNGSVASAVGCLCYLVGLFVVGSAVGIWTTELRVTDVFAVYLTHVVVQGVFFLPAFLVLGMGAGAVGGAVRRWVAHRRS
ncbi:hypothetical protein [Natronorarus salvus]|uniref:hypothetical protein n=1 Tax=Natronorarus salvus TaxID=3117733 RepID=UPI002F2620DC